ncbi:HAD hydrolase-like protein, partial [Patescibacteria group bacterium]|nr:HAD hydrolase-like protein [Patescibacteria group bacterium]
MTIILDLDYTLLDTERFKQALALVFFDCGISRERFIETYEDVVQDNQPAHDYDIDRHIRSVQTELTCSTKQIRRRVNDLLKETGDFLYPGAVDFVQELRNIPATVILLTLGNESWQRAKVTNSGLAEMFDAVLIVTADKSAAMKQFATIQPLVVIINDNYEEVLAMQRAAPSFKFIIKRGPKGCSACPGIKIVDTFQEVI